MIIIFMYIRNDTSSQFLFASPRLRSVPGDIVCGGGGGKCDCAAFPSPPLSKSPNRWPSEVEAILSKRVGGKKADNHIKKNAQPRINHHRIYPFFPID
jgi:hypothetical protein